MSVRNFRRRSLNVFDPNQLINNFETHNRSLQSSVSPLHVFPHMLPVRFEVLDQSMFPHSEKTCEPQYSRGIVLLPLFWLCMEGPLPTSHCVSFAAWTVKDLFLTTALGLISLKDDNHVSRAELFLILGGFRCGYSSKSVPSSGSIFRFTNRTF